MAPRTRYLLPALGLACLSATGTDAQSRRPAVSTGSACRQETSHDIIAAIAADGEITLTGGRRVKLVDLRLPERPDPAREKALAWLRTLPGSPVEVRDASLSDRWGRVPAAISIGGDRPIDIGELLVAEGLALVDAGERDVLCRPDLLPLEGGARARGRGLWAGAAWPVRADAHEDLAKAAGSFAIVEGRVVSVGERRERTYLNFGRDWSRDFNVTIPSRVWARLKERGISSASLSGRVVRVRGTVETRRAPTLDILAPDMLEVVDGGLPRGGPGVRLND